MINFNLLFNKACLLIKEPSFNLLFYYNNPLNQMPIAVFGSLNHDQVTRTRKFPSPGETVIGESFESHLGGKGFNEAIACAKLKKFDDKFTISLFGCIGNDFIKDKFINYLEKFNVKTDNLTILDNIQTGTATIIVQESDDDDDDENMVSNGENRIIITRGANKYFDVTFDQLDEFFNASNFTELNESINDTNLPSNLHSHSTKPLNGEKMAKTEDLNNLPPSNIHSHGSMASLANTNSNSSSDALVYKNGALIHNWSASGTNLANKNFSSDLLSSKITGSINDNNYNIHNRSTDSIPSDLHSHGSQNNLNHFSPSPKLSNVDITSLHVPSTIAERKPSISLNNRPTSNLNLTAQNRLTNVSFSLGGTSAHSSTTSLTPNQSMILNNIANRNPINIKSIAPSNDLKYSMIIQNEISNPHKIINYVSNKYPNVKIFYNPSPLPNKRSEFNNELLNSLHNSNYIIINETELNTLVKNFHSNPNRDPLTILQNISKFEPNNEFIEIVNMNIKLLSKLRTIITKPIIIVTLGEYGVLYSNQGSFSYAYIPSEDINDKVIDTTGAGDTFLGAIVTNDYRNENLENSIKFATRASAECIKYKGAAESIPLWKQVENKGWLL